MASRKKKQDTGHYYRLMVEHVKRVLADPKRVSPAYDATAGYEIAGFVWLPGWNDMVDGHTYPDHGKPRHFAAYSDLLSHFIRDVRKDLGAPQMPFVIGVMGVQAVRRAGADTIAFREAMTALRSCRSSKATSLPCPPRRFGRRSSGPLPTKKTRFANGLPFELEAQGPCQCRRPHDGSGKARVFEAV